MIVKVKLGQNIHFTMFHRCRGVLTRSLTPQMATIAPDLFSTVSVISAESAPRRDPLTNQVIAEIDAAAGAQIECCNKAPSLIQLFTTEIRMCSQPASAAE